ncbi:pilus assembly protein [Mesorhizobium sp. BR1-1-16]|uniref:TadE/TadG family type IV pilus assembly protein n=1 Tax=Mesorhizobium sp. BR1-1-16 TaxID=2876653 RepID=UPI001CCF7B99|nr:TadE/TadG family type IV pilus assembly protein [Mesorhizobium sp. BR1-1-16]MBZ9938510.1 pilus assembly protein [Mesorhizobium sp. BR1-1-16]
MAALTAGAQPDRLRRRFWGNTRGTAAVEFALIALPFFGLVAGMLETGIMMFADSALDTATNSAARLIRTGQAQQKNFSISTFRDSVCSEANGLFDCAKIKVDVRTAASFGAMALATPVKADGSLDDSNFAYSPGHGSDIVVVRVYYDWPIVLNRLATLGTGSNGKTKLLNAVVAFRNEPFNW